jgi:hypothetical protein
VQRDVRGRAPRILWPLVVLAAGAFALCVGSGRLDLLIALALGAAVLVSSERPGVFALGASATFGLALGLIALAALGLAGRLLGA